MRSLSTLLLALAVLTTVEASLIGERVEAVTVPESSVTAPVEILASVTVPESSVAYKGSDKELARQDLIAIVRGNDRQEERLSAFDRVWEQDDIFYLFFKPGPDRNVAVRVSAIEQMAEVDILKAIVGKVGVSEIESAIEERLKGIFPDGKGQRTSEASHVVGTYVRRMRLRK